ncbi:6,7-dimethyl-8-ribityllumazine synthase [Lactobacillus equicursoris DSM 19284 = JCM 14600 = CIP 110162]|uniref:6,7-dimethyl-8-ribityllumazine synthase n=1 Tax=Lactobacillus equicursoris DSM 19284 = JCM 14600 = CIP 110162 TaxID=1293597 RepID=K0NSX2_9LACO|nr:6,7-dimethyl-8-ribityllumazine synthase [Lactobacillus equicursoris]KRL03462.1 6,7-dimethyl-8-ribityllumazine synthase [Lactobacillus equicursoris DSM 19284 = JCM 14600 = CIP 110162]CCK85364.1 6,7-dimethyl-8-ribityllumazine synthase [Lactobacillus equicursoris DSM 19284 = JCM 14600 = CIP 110162]
MTTIQGQFKKTDFKVAIVVSRFNELVTKALVDGAVATLTQFGLNTDNIDVYWVPGAFEIGYLSKKLVDSGKYDGLMTLGAVIRGETDHYQMIINAVTNAAMTLNLEGKIPVTFGILTTDNIDQALQRSGLKVGNEGSATAQSLLEMMNLTSEI